MYRWVIEDTSRVFFVCVFNAVFKTEVGGDAPNKTIRRIDYEGIKHKNRCKRKQLRGNRKENRIWSYDIRTCSLGLFGRCCGCFIFSQQIRGIIEFVVACGFACRRHRADFRFGRQCYRAGADDRIQRAVRYYFVQNEVLWGNAYLSVNVRTGGGRSSHCLAETSVQR